MANFGLCNPWIAKYDPVTKKYSDAFKCGKAINTGVTPNYNEASLFADNTQVENVSEFKNATVSLGVDRMPVVAAGVMFGHTTKDAGVEISKAGDSGSWVGYGFITSELLDGVKKHRACLLCKVQFKEGEESFETKGDSIVFKTPTLSGIAMTNDEGEWRKKSPQFDTEEEADKWIQAELGVVEKCQSPVADVSGGEYTGTKEVHLSTLTKGATIKYTIDGTTPSESNGVEYVDQQPVEITETVGLRAIAFKRDAIASEVMTEEYFIKTT